MKTFTPYKWKHLPSYLRDAREKKSFTQSDVAFYIGIKVQSISNVERGACSLSPKHFRKIVQALDLDLDVLIKKHLADESDRLHHYL